MIISIQPTNVGSEDIDNDILKNPPAATSSHIFSDLSDTEEAEEI